MNPFDSAWALLKQQSLPPHPPAIQGLMARQYAADDENRFTPAFGPFEHSDMENWEGPSGDELRERMIQDEMRGRLARQSTGLARGGGDEHIDAEAYNQLAAEGVPYYGRRR